MARLTKEEREFLKKYYRPKREKIPFFKREEVKLILAVIAFFVGELFICEYVRYSEEWTFITVLLIFMLGFALGENEERKNMSKALVAEEEKRKSLEKELEALRKTKREADEKKDGSDKT